MKSEWKAMNNRKEIHDRVLNASTKEELMQAYQEWADYYDHDLIDELSYVAPLEASRLLKSYVENTTSRLLDAGCGTGLVGKCLHEFGYTNIDGLDYSESMLKKAQEKKVYNNLVQADLTAPLDVADDEYDAVICVGTFTCGHIGPEAFSQLIRIVPFGGHICFTVRDQAWQEDDYAAAIKSLVDQGQWELMEEQVSDYIQHEGSMCKVCIYRVTK
jgi:predicted TPR repeat methyltransferase